MTPKLNHVFFGVLVCLLGHVESLENFRDITHVEHVVRVSWSGQELILHGLEELDSADSEWLAKCLDLLGEVVEFEGGE